MVPSLFLNPLCLEEKLSGHAGCGGVEHEGKVALITGCARVNWDQERAIEMSGEVELQDSGGERFSVFG